MEKLQYFKGKYCDGTTAIQACNAETGELYATVSVNLGGYGMKPQNENCIFIPTYKFEFSDEFVQKIKDDLVKKVIRKVPIGFGEGIEVELKDNWKEFCEDWA